MDLPEVHSTEQMAIDFVVSIINKVHDYMGVRKNLFQLANTRLCLGNKPILSVGNLKDPLVINGEKLIKEAIEKTWRLTETFMYHINYLEKTTDECSQYYYYEVIFSQPTVTYPIPQVTASAFFRVEDKHIDPPGEEPIPMMIFRVEGHHTDHDIRYVRLIPDWILEVMMMKYKFFRRIEEIKQF